MNPLPAPLRPRTRGQCKDGPRPCPWVGCKHHLYLEIARVGSVKIPHVDKYGRILDPWQLSESCVLDVVDENPDGVTLNDVGELFRISRERVRQIEDKAGATIRAADVRKYGSCR